MKYLIITIVLVVIVAAGLLILNQPAANPDADNTLPKAPDFSLKDYSGNVISLSDFSGKPLIINSWAVWCPFCVDELPDFAAAQEEFGDQVTIIAIDRAESRAIVKKFTDELGISNKLIFLLDPSDSFYRSLGGFSMPETIFVDRDGFIQEHKRGPLSLEELRQKINNLIQN